jgi:hypothetical protein
MLKLVLLSAIYAIFIGLRRGNGEDAGNRATTPADKARNLRAEPRRLFRTHS